MNPLLGRTLLASLMALFLTGCFGPQKPEDVAADFWSAVIDNDADSVVDTSTLDNPAHFDGFDKNWNGYQPSWGKIIIDGKKARIDTTLSHASSDDRDVTTYLIQQDEEWQVDYERTARSASGGLFGNLLNKVSDLGRELGDRFTQSADEANLKMDQLLDELEANQEAFSEQAEQALKDYSEQLQQSLQAMDKSIQQTLEEQANRLSDTEKETLEAASNELEARLEAIDPESIQSAVENSKALTEMRDKLDALDTKALDEQKERWQELSEKLADDVKSLLDSYRK